MFGFNYTIRIPYNQARYLIRECRTWDHTSYANKIDEFEMNYIDDVDNFFRNCSYYLGETNIKICPKNFDLVIEGNVNIKEGWSNYQSGYDLWEKLSEYTRDFQIVINLPKDEIKDVIHVIFQKKNDLFHCYYIEECDKVRKEGTYGFINIDPNLFLENFCYFGSGEDYSKRLDQNTLIMILNELKNLYGIPGYDDKDHFITILNNLNII